MKKAFTLSEVLVTLVVIGVVAALTIPVMLSKIKKEQNLAVLKTAYADVYKFTQMYMIENNCGTSLSNCAPGAGEFTTSFGKYLKNKYHFVPLNKGKSGTAYFYGLNKASVTNSAFSDFDGTSSSRGSVSNNGNYMIITKLNQNDNYYHIKGDTFRAKVYIFTDNRTFAASLANKGNLPVQGRDVFQLFIMNSGKIVPNGSESCSTKNANGWAQDCGSWTEDPSCDTSHRTSDGKGCLARVITSGWKMEY